MAICTFIFFLNNLDDKRVKMVFLALSQAWARHPQYDLGECRSNSHSFCRSQVI